MTGNSQPDAANPSPSNVRVQTRSPFPDANDDFGLTPVPKAKIKLVDPLLGLDLGGFKIVKLIGEGGMGRVYEAHQEKPERTVAVKVIRQGITSEKTLRRFEREAEFLARLQHVGIAQIYVVGTYSSDSGDVPFYVMEYIANAKPITTYVREQNLHLQDRLRLFKLVCDAVSHGHDRGIVHRDLKPGNLLIDAHGCPKVIDFGVARSTDSELQITKLRTDTGQLVGTVQYMSPEQFGETPHDLDERVDVYSLGVVLYEMLAGRPPYSLHKKPIHEIARIICQQRPEPLGPQWNVFGWMRSSKFAGGDDSGLVIPRGVDAIVQKCLRKDRRKRYSTAGELGAAIQKFLDDEQARSLRKFTYGRSDGWGRFFGGIMSGPSSPGQPGKRGARGLMLLALLVGLGVTSFWVVAQAMAPPTKAQREAEEVRQAILANFDACNREDVSDLMGTISRQAPDRREFERQAKALFGATDVYMGLAEFEVLELRPPFASARVVQITLPANAEDRTRGGPREVFFRDRSGLLPKWEACEYTQTFRKENGKWKLHLITTEPKPVEATMQGEEK